MTVPIPDQAKRRRVVVIIGQSGEGKSLFFKTRVLPYYNRALIATPTDESYPYAREFHSDKALIRYAVENRVCRVLKRCRDQYDLSVLAATAMALGNSAFCCDEAAVYFRNQRAALTPILQDIIFRSRHRNVDVVLMAQRASTLNIDIRSQATEIITFRQIIEADIRALQYVAGKEAVPDLATLPVGSYYRITRLGTSQESIPLAS